MIICCELRIGNYVMTPNGRQQVARINKAAGFDQAGISVQESTDEKDTPYNLSNIHPVLISEDVLRQCGFVYHDYFKFWQLISGAGNDRSEMNIDRDYNILDFMRKSIVKNVASLHQLQNIYFMLKGKELDVQPLA